MSPPLPPEIDLTAGPAVLLVPPAETQWWSDDQVRVCVVGHPPPPVPDGRRALLAAGLELPVRRVFGDGRCWEIEYWPEHAADRVLDAVEAAQPGEDELLSVDDVRFLDALARGRALAGPAWLRDRQARLDRLPAGELVAGHEFARAQRQIELAVGFLVDGCPENAVLAALSALGHAVDGLLARHGCLVAEPSRRYERYRRLGAAVPGLPPAREYWALQTMRDSAPGDPGPWVDEALRFCAAVLTHPERPRPKERHARPRGASARAAAV